MFVAPGGFKIVSKIGRLAIVKIYDPTYRVFFTFGLNQHRIGRECDPIRFESEMIGYLTGRFQILRHQRRRDCERLARVVEAGLVRGIYGELTSRTEINSSQIADGVVVLC